MRLLSENMLQKLPSRKDIRDIPQTDFILHYHIYNPIGVGDWFVVAQDRDDDDVELFVLEALDGVGFRMRSLRSMSNLRFTCGQRLRRDKTFKRRSLAQLREDLHFLI